MRQEVVNLIHWVECVCGEREKVKRDSAGGALTLKGKLTKGETERSKTTERN